MKDGEDYKREKSRPETCHGEIENDLVSDGAVTFVTANGHRKFLVPSIATALS